MGFPVRMPVWPRHGQGRGPGSTNRPGPRRPDAALEDAALEASANSADLVQPADGRAVPRVPEYLELFVPRDAEEEVDLVLELLGIAT